MRVSEPVDDDSTSSGDQSEFEESASQSDLDRRQSNEDTASSSGSDSEEAQVSTLCLEKRVATRCV